MKKFFVLLFLIYLRTNIAANKIRPQRSACTNKSKTEFCSKFSNGFNITAVNHSLGRTDMMLPDLTHCSNGTYYITLWVYENVTNEIECDNTVTNNHENISHTEINYNCSLPRVTNIPTMTFQYVFSGCYRLEIGNHKTGKANTYPVVYITTDYKKEHLNNNAIKFIARSKNNVEQIDVIINSTNILKPPSSKITLREVSCQGDCIDITATTQGCYLGSNHTESDTNLTEQNKVKLNCSPAKGASCTCKITGLRNSTYGFRYEIDQYICKELALYWENRTRFCDTTFYFNITADYNATRTTYNIINNDTKLIYIIVITTAAVIIITIGLVLYFVYKRPKVREDFKSYYHRYTLASSDECLIQFSQEILIIYARDFDLFMQMMESFKRLLSCVEGTTVFDINTRYEKVDQNPQDWILKKISDENVIVILFLNSCSSAAYSSQQRNIYRIPRDKDLLFPYSVRQLKYLDTRNYKNLFITYLPSISTDTNIFNDLNPATRYALPVQINELLNDIFQNKPNVDNSLLKDFNNLCAQCIDFEKDNPEYIREVLNVRIM